MLSRVASNIYWMARYLERAEGVARLINVNSNLLLDLPKGISPKWGQLVSITGADELYSQEVDDSDRDGRQALKILITDEKSPVSLVTSIVNARENARTVRDVMPREVWEAINSLFIFARDSSSQALGKRGRYQFLSDVIEQCQTISGILAGTMNRDAGYMFLEMGRLIERADMTSRIIDTRSANLLPNDHEMDEESPALLEAVKRRTYDSLQWMSVLKSLTGYQMYRLEMQVRIQRQEVLKFLMQSTVFPRSITRCILEIEATLEILENGERALLVINRLKRQLDHANFAKLKQTELQHFVDQLQVGFSQLHEELGYAYFGQIPEVKQAQTQAAG